MADSGDTFIILSPWSPLSTHSTPIGPQGIMGTGLCSCNPFSTLYTERGLAVPSC